MPKLISIIYLFNSHNAPFNKVLILMKAMMNNPPVRVVFAEDEDFTNLFLEVFVPNLLTRSFQVMQMVRMFRHVGLVTRHNMLVKYSPLLLHDDKILVWKSSNYSMTIK